MYTNNLVLDYENKINIKQNENNFFMIGQDLKIKSAVKINIQPFEEIDYLNLYIIIKSYICNLQYVPSNFFICIKNVNEDFFIAYNSNVSEFKNITFYGFCNWLINQTNNDWKYVETGGEYYFLINFTLEIFDKSLIKVLKPKYPWTSDILEKFAKLKENEEYYIQTIEVQKREIEDLKKKIMDLEQKSKEKL